MKKEIQEPKGDDEESFDEDFDVKEFERQEQEQSED